MCIRDRVLRICFIVIMAAGASLFIFTEAGILDAARIVNSLIQHGFDGDCALEMTCPSYFNNPREVLARALSVLKGCER